MFKLLMRAAPVALVLFAGPAFAQATATATANGLTRIIQPITITKTADLNFGRIVKPSSGTGTVAMANSADTVSGAAGAVAISGITTSRAKFTIGGEGAQTFSLTIPASFTLTGGATNITVTLDSDTVATSTLSGTLGTAGTKALNIGGTFSVPAAATTGDYTGSFSVTVAYN